MLSLTVSHHIHLTKEQRYHLHDGQDLEVVGVSVPIWFMNKLTTEPGKEVFCRYVLKNPKEDKPVQILQDGYEITLPYRPGTKLQLTDEEWRTLNNHHPQKLDDLYRTQVAEVSSKNLLDVSDGGCGHLFYREHNKVKRGEKLFNIMHFVAINTIDKLIESLS